MSKLFISLESTLSPVFTKSDMFKPSFIIDGAAKYGTTLERACVKLKEFRESRTWTRMSSLIGAKLEHEARKRAHQF